MTHPSFAWLTLALVLTGCLISPDVTKLYERSVPVDGPRADRAADVARDLRRDGPGPDARLSEMRLDQPASDIGPPLGSGGARLLYGETAPALLHRAWSSASGWGAPGSLLPMSQAVVWTLNQVSPTAAGDEAALVLGWGASGTELQMLGRTPITGWSVGWSTNVVALAEIGKRGFDLAHEQSSGDLLVVYSDDTATPRYRTRSGGSWSAEQALPLNDGAANPNPDLNSGKVLWVELVPRPGTDEVALLYADAAADLVAIVWDGSQWKATSAAVLETTLKVNPGSGVVHQRCFDGAWEGKSGDLVVAWGKQDQSGYLAACRPASTGLWSPAPGFSGVSGMIEFVDLEGQAGGDLIAGAFMDQGNGTERLALATWDGTAWINALEYDSQTRDVNDLAFGDAPSAVAWLDAGTAVAVYADDATNVLDWARWTPATGWVIQPDVTVFNKGYTESVLLAPVPGKSQVMVVFSDSKSQLGWGTFDGASWTMSPVFLSSAVASLDAAPFSLAFQK